MPHVKKYMITVVSDNKSDFGIELMEGMLKSLIQTYSSFRKSYYAHIKLFEGKELDDLNSLERKHAVNVLDKK